MRKLLPFVLFGLTGGCASSVGDAPTPPSEETLVAHGQIVVERSSLNGEARSEVVARFARFPVAQSEEAFLRSVGSFLDLPDLGACGPVSHVDPRANNVELLHLGTASIESEARVHPLHARKLPELVEWASGYVYSGSEPLPPSGAYVLRVGKNELALTFEGEPTSLKLSESPVGNELSWDRGAHDGETIFVDVFDGKKLVRRCHFADVGLAILSELPQDGTLVIHRLRVDDVYLSDFGPAEVRFDFSRTLPLHAR